MSVSPIITQSYDLISSIMFQANLATQKEINDIQGIFGYMEREGFLGKIFELLHRIWNAVKAVFGQSDWQRAVNAFSSVQEKLKDRLNLPISVREFPTDQLLSELLEALNIVNQKIKVLESVALGIFNACIPCINKEKIGADLAAGNGVFDQDAWNTWGHEQRSDEDFSQRIMTLIGERGYVTAEGLSTIEWVAGLLNN